MAAGRGESKCITVCAAMLLPPVLLLGVMAGWPQGAARKGSNAAAPARMASAGKCVALRAELTGHAGGPAGAFGSSHGGGLQSRRIERRPADGG